MTSPSLAELQRRLACLISAPAPADDEARRVRQAEASALGIVGDDRLDAGGRTGIYAGMWFARIHDAVAEDYPATRLALGERGFADLLREYLAECPPSNPSLRHAGDRLARSKALGRAPGAPAWLADLAAFEHAIVVSFDARDEPVLRGETLAGLAPPAWPGFVVRRVASLVVLRPRHPVDAIRDRLLEGVPLDDLPEAPAPAALLSWRQEERVFHRRADALEAALLDAARPDEGIPFASLCELAARHLDPGGQTDDGPPDPAEAVLARLELWLRDDVLVDVFASA